VRWHGKRKDREKEKANPWLGIVDEYTGLESWNLMCFNE
jgi:hypothetical protein